MDESSIIRLCHFIGARLVPHRLTETIRELWTRTPVGKQADLGIHHEVKLHRYRNSPKCIPFHDQKVWFAESDLRLDLIDTVLQALNKAGIDEPEFRFELMGQVEIPGWHHRSIKPWEVVVYADCVPVGAVAIFHHPNPSRLEKFPDGATSVLMGMSFNYEFSGEQLSKFKPYVGHIYIRGNGDDGGDFPYSYEDRLEADRDTAARLRRHLYDGDQDSICYLYVDKLNSFEATEPVFKMGFNRFIESMASGIRQRQQTIKEHDLWIDDLDYRLAQRHGYQNYRNKLSSAELAVIRKRRLTLAKLRRLVLNKETTENSIQKTIGTAYWVFGGQYVGILKRRDLMRLNSTISRYYAEMEAFILWN
jgi:hypothetical protein